MTFEDDKFNPWNVQQLEDFLFFCCPECEDKSSTKAIFINHALVEHPKVSRRAPARAPARRTVGLIHRLFKKNVKIKVQLGLFQFLSARRAFERFLG